MADAKRAGLAGKPGPWQQYPGRMLSMRARAWAIRDGAADALMGLQVADETSDQGPSNARDVTPKRGSVVYLDEGPALPPPVPERDEIVDTLTPDKIDAKMAEVAAEFAGK